MQINNISANCNFGTLHCYQDINIRNSSIKQLKKEFKNYENWDMLVSDFGRNILINKNMGLRIGSPFIAQKPKGKKMEVAATWLNESDIPFLAPKYQNIEHAHEVKMTLEFLNKKQAMEAYNKLQNKDEFETSVELLRILEKNNKIC